MTSAGILALASLMAGPLILRAQSDVVIRSTTRLVQVHVVAQDREGRAVSGLRREDFRIFDDRKERPLASFAEESVTPLAASPESGHPASETAGTGLGYSAILLDWLNGGFGDRLRGDDAARKVLQSLPARQKVAVYVLGMEPPGAPHPLRVVSDFTDEFSELANLIEDPMVLPNPEIGEAPGRFDARYGGGGPKAGVEEQLFDWRNRIQDTLRALTDLADRMARLPGKKSLIWLTTGFPMVVNGNVVPGAKGAADVYLQDVDRVLRRLNRLNITVHTVNTKGLATMGRSYNETLQSFAERTGGTAFFDRNDLDIGVRTALNDLHAGYTLGFLVPEGTSPGAHAIQVKTVRAGVKLRFRESYELGN